MELIQIKKKFENKNFSIRMDFINEYDFKDSYNEYYRRFLTLNLGQVKNAYYLSDLVDLSGYLKFDDDTIYKKILILLKHKNLLVKLSVFDYLKRAERFYNDKSSEKMIINFIKQNSKQIKSSKCLLQFMAYQVLIQFNVFHGHISSARKYFEIYKSLLEKSNNSAMVWRAYKDSIGELLLSYFKKEIYVIASKKNVENNFGHKIV